MRMVGICGSEALASKFIDYLVTLGIDGEIRSGQNGAWAVWIYGEDDLERAAREYRAFQTAPDAPEYARAAEASAIRRKIESQNKNTAYRAVDLRTERAAVKPLVETPVTLVLMIASIAVTLLAKSVSEESAMVWIACTPDGLLRGELWRLVTPIFIHFGLIHIIFNMLWLYNFGRVIESAKGGWFLVGLVALTAAIPNLLQMAMRDPMFGGMSGVVYGLFGYIWLKSRVAPEPGIEIDPLTVAMVLFWFIICILGLVRPVANWVHGAGLALGALCGAASALRRMLRSH